MPIYEYRCDACGHEDEEIQKISDEPLTVCPRCGAAEYRKLISAAGFRLKGGGWYETDFKSGNKKNLHGDKEKAAAGKSDAKASGGDKGASGGKSDSAGGSNAGASAAAKTKSDGA